jgi:hypothetical protein
MSWNLPQLETEDQRRCLRPYLMIAKYLIEAFPRCIQITRRGAYNIHVQAEETNARYCRNKGCTCNTIQLLLLLVRKTVLKFLL